MKKHFFFAMILCFSVVFLSMNSLVFAKGEAESQVDKETYTNVEKGLQTAHYDYDKSSLNVIDSKTSAGITALFVEYETIRDHLFKKNHHEVLYYDTTEKTLLTSATDKTVLSFADTYKEDVHVTVSHVAVMSVIAVAYLIAYFVMRIAATKTKN